MTTSTAPKVDVAVDKTGNKVSGRFTVKNLPTFDVAEATKPLYAAVGVADLAIEQVKDVPSQVKTLPNQVKSLSTEVTDKATDLYAKLAVRGERLLTQIRRQPATEAAIAEGKEAVRKAEAAATAAKKSVQAGEKAVGQAAAKLG